MNTIRTVRTTAIAACALLMLASSAGAVTAAAATAPSPAPAATDSRMNAGVIAKFEELLEQKGGLPQASAYLYANLDRLTIAQTTNMALHLEEAISKQLNVTQLRFEPAAMQEAIGAIYKNGDTLSSLIAKTKDAKLKALLTQTRNSGYKLETGEGMYYIVANYATFNKYSARLTNEIRDYFKVRAAESDARTMNDGALAIGYDQLAERAAAAEQFLKQYPKSIRTAQVSGLFNIYNVITFYGANNTPLFDDDTKAMREAAKTGYAKALESLGSADGEYVDNLSAFMDVLKDHDYKLTKEVEQFRAANVPI
ncbi:hypothetical protein BCM02_101876 [Paenibacillus methanolicus]|uniref:DUF3829 domain-containing protein n=2 Tax=Paenibacillus methanolicus TaxID=582686 RepID=A0A5S5CM70_9BACL|nr:hypothetical protein BCM02_101876 [Paenibacillus methanolicus]